MKHIDLIKVLLISGSGFTATLTNIDLMFKVLIGAATLIYLGIKIWKEFKK